MLDLLSLRQIGLQMFCLLRLWFGQFIQVWITKWRIPFLLQLQDNCVDLIYFLFHVRLRHPIGSLQPVYQTVFLLAFVFKYFMLVDHFASLRARFDVMDVVVKIVM